MASQNGAPHPRPPPVRVPPPPPRDPGNRRRRSEPPGGGPTSLGPRASPPAQSGGVPCPPHPGVERSGLPAAGLGAPPALGPVHWAPAGAAGGSTRVHVGTRGPEPLPATAPLSADQVASAVTAPPSALSASSGTSSSMAARADPLASGRPEGRTRGAAAAAEQQPPPTGGSREGAEPGAQEEGRGRRQALRHHARRAPPIGARGRGLSASPAPERLERPHAPRVWKGSAFQTLHIVMVGIYTETNNTYN